MFKNKEEYNNNNNLLNNVDCFTFFFNLIISQLFISSITYVIEFLRLITINILSKFFLSEYVMRQYGVYIQPIITSILLLCVGFMLYYLINSLMKSCETMYLMMFAGLIFLIIVLATYIIWNWYNYKNYYKKLNYIEKEIS
jgi:hypothetical protein